jgi:hypothetical protein
MIYGLINVTTRNIWDLCNKKGGNCQGKSNLCLYAKYDFWAEISPDLALTQFLFFLAVSLPLIVWKCVIAFDLTWMGLVSK